MASNFIHLIRTAGSNWNIALAENALEMLTIPCGPASDRLILALSKGSTRLRFRKGCGNLGRRSSGKSSGCDGRRKGHIGCQSFRPPCWIRLKPPAHTRLAAYTDAPEMMLATVSFGLSALRIFYANPCAFYLARSQHLHRPMRSRWNAVDRVIAVRDGFESKKVLSARDEEHHVVQARPG